MGIQELTAQERRLTRRVDFLEGVIDLLQKALGVQVEVEAHQKERPKTKINFSVTVGGGVWEDCKHYPEIREALYLLINYKVEKLLKDGSNGWFEEIDLSKISSR